MQIWTVFIKNTFNRASELRQNVAPQGCGGKARAFSMCTFRKISSTVGTPTVLASARVCSFTSMTEVYTAMPDFSSTLVKPTSYSSCRRLQFWLHSFVILCIKLHNFSVLCCCSPGGIFWKTSLRLNFSPHGPKALRRCVARTRGLPVALPLFLAA